MNSDIIIVGGGPAGIISALTAKSVYADKSVILIKDIGDGVIPCAIPYMLHTLDDPEKNRLGNEPLDAAGVHVIVDKALELNADKKTISLASGETTRFPKVDPCHGIQAGDAPPYPESRNRGCSVLKKASPTIA